MLPDKIPQLNKQINPQNIKHFDGIIDKISKRCLRNGFTKVMIYQPEDQQSINVIHYDRHKQGISIISQTVQHLMNKMLLRGFYALKNSFKKVVMINQKGRTQKNNEKYRKNSKQKQMMKSQSVYTLALSRDRLNQKSTKTLGAKKRSQKDLFIKKSAIKTIKHQYRSQAILGF